MKWFITGGAGFIGCNMANRLLTLGHQVVVLDNLSRGGSTENLLWLRKNGLAHFVYGDIRDPEMTRRVMRQHPDIGVVLHLAAQVAVTHSFTDPYQDFMVNALGTLNVLEAVRTAPGRPTVLFSSTNKVYGDLTDLQVIERSTRFELPDLAGGISEEFRLSFQTPYACSKGTADLYMADYARSYGIPAGVFRQSCIYGLRQNGEEDQGWLTWLMSAAQRGYPITLYGTGKQVRDALWVDDLVDLFLLSAREIPKTGFEVFNVGGGPTNTISLLELLEWIDRAGGKAVVPRRAEARAGDQNVFVCDLTKVKSRLGWEPKTTLKQGLALLWDSLVGSQDTVDSERIPESIADRSVEI